MSSIFEHTDEELFIDAIVRNNIERVKSFLAGRGWPKIDPNFKNGALPVLMMTALGGRTEVARLLIEAGADVNAKDNTGKTALMYAAYYGHTGVMRLLIDKGARLHERGNNGETALEYAATGRYRGESTEVLETAMKERRQKSLRAAVVLQRNLPCRKLRLKTRQPS